MKSTHRSAAAKAWQHLYATSRWRKVRAIHLAAQPLCFMCNEDGRLTPATVVDHIVPHKGDERLFFDAANLSSLCKSHHDMHKQSEERTGKAIQQRGADGWPINPARAGLGDISHPEWFTPVRVPLTIVCGPPASGKTTYVAKRKGPRDIVFDLDVIAVQQYGKPSAMLDLQQRLACLKLRNKQLSTLMSADAVGSFDMAWLILTEAKASRRQWWADTVKPSSIVVLETSVAKCVERANADRQQQRPADTPRRVADWWVDYGRRDGETRVVT